jgi:hypothetical protein
MPSGGAAPYWWQELTSSNKILWHGGTTEDANELVAVTDIAAGTTGAWVPLAGYLDHEVTSTDLLYLLADTQSVRLCRRPLTSLGSAPLCVTVTTGDYTIGYTLSLASLGALTFVHIEGVQVVANKAYIASASLTAVVPVVLPSGSSVDRAVDGFSPYLIVRDANTVPSVKKVLGDGSLSTGFAIPFTTSVAPTHLAVTPDRVVGSDSRDGSQSMPAWTRPVSASGFGAETSLPGRATDIGASAGRTIVVGAGQTSAFDRNSLQHTFSGDPSLFDAQISGPYVTQGLARNTTNLYSSTSLADGSFVAETSGWWPGAQFGSLFVTTTFDPLLSGPTHVHVLDLVTTATRSYTLATGPASCWVTDVWGTTLALYCANTSGPAVRIYDYTTGQLLASRNGILVEGLGDGYAVVSAGSTFAVFAFGANTLTPIAGCSTSQDLVATDGVGHVVCASATELIWQDHSALSTSAPRVLGVLADKSVSFAGGATLWKPQFDTTKALSAGSILIKNAAGVTVRTLATPASADGSVRGISWNGLDGTGKAVPIGTYTYQLVANAADGTGALVSVSGTGTTTGTVKVIAASTVGLGAGAFEPVSPSRVLDTRVTGGALGPAGVRSAQVTGVGGVPSTGVAAVVLNVTVTDTTSGGYLTVYPTGATKPLAANLNWSASGSTIPNAVTAKVGTGGKVDLFQSGPGSAQVVIDIAGYYLSGPVADAGGFVSLTPARILDTRSVGGKLAPYETRDLQVTGAGGVPDLNVSAVVLNVTVTDTTSTGYLTVFPSGSSRPTAANLNWSGPLVTIPNLVVAKLGANGKISIYENGPGVTHVVVDVAGYYLGGTPTKPGTFVSLTPARVLDTRATAPIAGYGSLSLGILGKGGIPASGVSAVVINTTVTETKVPGFLTVYPGTTDRPLAANLNWTGGGVTIPNLVTTPVGTDGTIAFFNGSYMTVHVVVDAAGYFIGA